MIFEDSRNALYCDPNAFIQKYDKQEKCEPKKVIFQEPYESLPAFYIDNNFKKHDCNYCERNDKHNFKSQNNSNIDCNNHCKQENLNGQCYHDFNCNHNVSSKQKGSGFDLKSLLPLLGIFNKSGGTDFSQIVGLLNNNTQKDNNSNPMTIISSLLSNGGLGNILNIFKGGQKTKSTKKELKTTDFEIKNYTRVE